MFNDAIIFRAFAAGQWHEAEKAINTALATFTNVSQAWLNIWTENNILYIAVGIENRQTAPLSVFFKHFINDESTSEADIETAVQTWFDNPQGADEVFIFCQSLTVSEITKQIAYIYQLAAH